MHSTRILAFTGERHAGLLVENLGADGFRAVGATSAGEGVRAIEVRRPSPVVLDLALENGSGLELLDRCARRMGSRRGSIRTGPSSCSPGGRGMRIAC